MATLITKNSSTAAAAPLAADLTQGELAVNVTDKKLYSKDSGGAVVKLVGGLGNQEANAVAITGGAVNGTTVGATTASTGAFTTLAASGAVTLSGGTANGVTYLNGSKVLTSGSALVFDGSQFKTSVSGNTPIVNETTGGTSNYLQLKNTGGSAYIGSVSNDLAFYYSGSATEGMRLTSTGLGIGTSSPWTKLSVYGSGSQRIAVTSPTGGATVAALDLSPSLTAGEAASYDPQARIYAVDDNYSANIIFANKATGATANSLQTRMTLNSAGNLGLGVTPSAWSGYKALQVNNGAFANSSGTTLVGWNSYYDGSNYKYIVTGQASQMLISPTGGGGFAWYNAASGTAGNTISFTQAMTLDASGNLGIGTTSPSTRLHIAGATTATSQLTTQHTGSAVTTVFGCDGGIDAGAVYVTTNHPLAFKTNNTERARIDASGNLLVGTTSNSATSGVGIKSVYDTSYPYISTVGTATTNSNVAYTLYSTGAAAYRFYVGYAGTVYATSTTITAISDQRLKENIRDLDEGLATVMALKPRKFDWKEGKGQDIKNARGFIAQEFETVLPDMIETWRDPAPEGEEPYKAINANLIPTLVKALQELNAKFEAYVASHP